MTWRNEQKRYATLFLNRLIQGKKIRCGFAPHSKNWCRKRGFEGQELRWLRNTRWLLCQKHFIEASGADTKEWEGRENCKHTRIVMGTVFFD